MHLSTLSIRIATACVCSALLCTAADTYILDRFPAQDPAVDTVRFALMNLKNNKFYSRGDRNSVNVLTNEPDTMLTYKVWMQDDPAPLAIIIPGLGGHCASLAPAVIAEKLYNNGMSVLSLSSPFSWDFVLNGATAVAPGFTPQDTRDLYQALAIILRDIGNEYGTNLITRKAVLGYSLGGLETLFLADIEARDHALGIDRFVAINTPVNLFNGLKQLDDYYCQWTNWSRPELEARKNSAIEFFMNSVREPVIARPQSNDVSFLPLFPDEGMLAIGLVYHRSLSEVIKAVHKRKDFGFIKTPYRSSKTRFLDEEIERFCYANYLMTFMKAAHSNIWTANKSSKEVNKLASLPAIQDTLVSNPNIRVIHTLNDFLLTDYDRDWLRGVLGDRLTLFDCGGHLGFLYRDDVLEYLAYSLGCGSNVFTAATADQVAAKRQQRQQLHEAHLKDLTLQTKRSLTNAVATVTTAVVVATNAPPAAATNVQTVVETPKPVEPAAATNAVPAAVKAEPVVPKLVEPAVNTNAVPAAVKAEPVLTNAVEEKAAVSTLPPPAPVKAEPVPSTNQPPAPIKAEPVAPAAVTNTDFGKPLVGVVSNVGGRSDITIENYGE